MKVNVFKIVVFTSACLLVACSSDKVREEEYEFAGSVTPLEIPPNLIKPDSQLIMEIPRPSEKACEKLMQADARFKVKKAAEEAAAAEEKRKQQEREKADAKSSKSPDDL